MKKSGILCRYSFLATAIRTKRFATEPIGQHKELMMMRASELAEDISSVHADFIVVKFEVQFTIPVQFIPVVVWFVSSDFSLI